MLTRRQFFLAEWFFVLTGMAAVGGYVGYFQYQDFQRIGEYERTRLTQQTAIVEHNLVPQLAATNRALLTLIEDLPQWLGTKAGVAGLNRRLQVIRGSLPGVQTLLVLNAQGKIIASNHGTNINTPLSSQDWFQQAARNNTPLTLYLAPPQNTLGGSFAPALVRSLAGSKGEFSGVVFASLHHDFAKILLESVLYTPDSQGYFTHGDGPIFFITPEHEALVGADQAGDGSFFSRHRLSGQPVSLFTGILDSSATERMAAFRTIQPAHLLLDTPLVVTVSRDVQAVFAPWRSATVLAGALFAVLMLMATSGLYLYQRLRLRTSRLAQEQADLLKNSLLTDLALTRSEQKFSTAFSASPVAASIASLNEGRYLEINRNFERDFGWAAADLIGKTSVEVGVWPDAPSRQAWGLMIRQKRRIIDYETVLVHKSGERRHVSLSAEITDIHGEECILAYATDITARKRTEERINTLAFYDQLTGLPNRTLLMDRLSQAMTLSERSGRYAGLLCIDLDHFKILNDTMGHDTGDLLLQQVAGRLTTCVREGDTVARIGGDEFVVILATLNSRKRESASAIETVAEKILFQLNQVYQFGDTSHQSSASLGATLIHGHFTPVDDLMKQAELAMYRTKETGRNAIHFFDPQMEVAVLNRIAQEKSLREAVHKQEFFLYYQPQVVGDGQLTGAEALVRWRHPVLGMVSPAEFIPLAEETGLIVPLGMWVLEAACVQLALWAQQPARAHLTMAVNVSAHQFRQPDFVEQVLRVLKRTGAQPKLLKLELTESLLVTNVDETIDKMFSLKAKGVGFSLDDFGTGYSSLAYLKRLPLDQLKIDQSFVRDVLLDPNDAAIAKTIVALAQSLGLGVIAEGVETQAQKDFLANHSCHAYQGFLFSKPLPIELFEAFATKG